MQYLLNNLQATLHNAADAKLLQERKLKAKHHFLVQFPKYRHCLNATPLTANCNVYVGARTAEKKLPRALISAAK